jgi:hypothetical protein
MNISGLFRGPFFGILLVSVIIVFSFFFLQTYFVPTLIFGLLIIISLSLYRFWQPRMNQLSYYASLVGGTPEEEKKTFLLRAKNEPAPATRGSGAHSLVVMYWGRWSRSIWQKYGKALLGREHAVDKWADERDYSVLRPAAPNMLTGNNSVPALFADEKRQYIFYPRNKVVAKIKNHKVTLIDANKYFMPEDSTHDLVPSLEPSTAAITGFPEEYVFIATPKTKNNISLWISLAGRKILSGNEAIDKKFDFYTSDPKFGVSILSEAALNKLSSFPNARVVAERGILVVVSLSGWVLENDLDAFCELARKFSKNAFALDEYIKSLNAEQTEEDLYEDEEAYEDL